MSIPAFQIGVFSQPIQNMKMWRDRGINMLCSHEPESGKVPKPLWEQAATDLGLRFMDYPDMANLVVESKQPNRVAWMQPDEPDLVSHVNSPGSTIGDLQTTYKKLKLQAPTMPVYLNMAGPSFDAVAYDGTPHPTKTDASKAGHRAATGGYMAWADWLDNDYYLAQSGRKGAFYIQDRLADRLADWSGNKPYFITIETHGATNPFSADDFEQEFMRRIIYACLKGHKILGVVYWAHKFGVGWPQGWDGTTPEIVARMMRLNSRLAAYAGDIAFVPTPTLNLQPVLLAAQANLTAANNTLNAVKALT